LKTLPVLPLFFLAGNARPLEELILEQSTYLAEYDPVAVAKTLSVPMLILQGERDYQVTMTDFNRWKSALSSRKNVEFRSYAQLNHLFVAGDGKSSPAAYEKPAHVTEQVISDIAAWILRHR
jgi:fermentation-respiration switch protein FrsA (DUF1100 family)